MQAESFSKEYYNTARIESILPRREGILQVFEPFPTGSTMAQFYLIDDGKKLAKVYTVQDDPSINVRFSIPAVREGVIKNEIAMGNALSKGYGGELATVRVPAGQELTAVIMNRLDQRQNLRTQLDSGIMPSEETWINIARQLAGAHFNPDIARRVDVGLFSDFLRQLMDSELNLLLGRYEGKSSLIKHIYTTADEFISKHASAIDRYCALTGEPVLTHGDEKTENMFLSDNKTVDVIDAVPRPDWAVNLRDIAFILEELKILELPGPRSILINEYTRLYFQELRKREIGEIQIEDIAATLPMLNSIMSVYRLGIFARLADLDHLDDRQKDWRLQLLEEAGEKINRML